METIIDYGIKLIFAALSFIVITYLVPWLKEKKLYGIVMKLVEAAEKINENSTIDKKEYVLKILASKGITVTPYVEAIIEGCVKELDIALKKK